MSLYSIDKEKYNGWNNFATWKLFTEVFAGIDLMNKVSAEDVKHMTDEFLLDGLLIQTPLQPMEIPLAMEYAREFTKLADYEELADAINETNQDNWETVAV